ncbi:hypothetical protein Tco_0963871 [Tanacetum coccineum]
MLSDNFPSSSLLFMIGCPRLYSGTVRFGNDQIARIKGYGEYQLGNFRTELQGMTPATSSTGLGSNPISNYMPCSQKRDDWDRLFQPMFDEYFNPPPIAVSPVQEAAAPRAEVLADSPMSTFIDQDALSIRSSSKVRQIHTPFEHLGRWTKDHPIANVIGDPSRFVSTRKQLETDAMWCYFNAFLTSIEPKNFKQAMTEQYLVSMQSTKKFNEF